MTMSSSDHRYEVLDGLRGIAAISVMLIHLPTGRHALMPHAAISVDLFFILSGFVLTRSYRERLLGGMSVWSYLKRRLIRIYPMFFVGMVIGVVSLVVAIRAGESGYPLRSYLSSVVSNFLFIPYFGNYGTPNMVSASSGHPLAWTYGEIFPSAPPARSLFFEMIGSAALLPIIVIKRRTLRTAILGSALLITFSSVLASFEQGRHEIFMNFGWSTTHFLGGFLKVAFGFACGVYIATMQNNQATSVWGRKFNTMVRNDVTLYALFIVLISVPWGIKGLYPALLIFVTAPLLVWRGAALHPTGPLSRSIARFLGWISYPVYCLHYPIGRLLFLTVPSFHEKPAIGTMVTVVTTLVVAMVVTRIFEEPVRSYLSRRFTSEGRASLKMPATT